VGGTRDSSAIEGRLLAIWAEILDAPPIDVHANFFDIGGDSLLMLQLIAAARAQGLEISVRQFHRDPTITGLAASISRHGGRVEPLASPVDVPLTPTQESWFESITAANADPDTTDLMPLLFEAPTRFETTLLTGAIRAIMLHHDALRTSFRRQGKTWTQRTLGPELAQAFSPLEVTRTSARGRGDPELSETAQTLRSRVSLSDGSVLQAAIVRGLCGEPDCVLLLVHHLVCDAISAQIVADDLDVAFSQLRNDTPISLPPRPASFAQWAAFLSRYQQSDALHAEAQYWESQLRLGPSPLPRDTETPINTFASVRTAGASCGADLTRELMTVARAMDGVTLADIVLSAVLTTLRAWTGETAFIVRIEGHGRSTGLGDSDVSSTVGWLSVWFDVKFGAASGDDPLAAARAVRRQREQIPNGGIGFGLLRREASRSRTDAAMPQADVLFNHTGAPDIVERSSRLLPRRPLPTDLAERFYPYGPQAPARPRSQVLDVTSQIVDGRLALSIDYSEDVHRRETITQQLAALTRELSRYASR
jgi:non-ribosomal peptide synthase protein (TIGR01720 family)